MSPIQFNIWNVSVLLKVLLCPLRTHLPFPGLLEETNMLNFMFVILKIKQITTTSQDHCKD